MPKDDLKAFGANGKRIASQFPQSWYKTHAPKDFYCVKIMALDASQRCQGKFRRLIEPTLEDCSSRDLPVVLETNSAANCPICERFGFVRMETFDIRPKDFRIYCYVKPS